MDYISWGTARPLFRVGSNRYVFNEIPSSYDLKFTPVGIVNEAIDTGYLNIDRKGWRGIFTFNYDKITPTTLDLIRTLLSQSDSVYLRPHFNYAKEYEVSLMEQPFHYPYLGTMKGHSGQLVARTRQLLTELPNRSQGGLIFDSNTSIQRSITLGGDITVEMQIKTPSNIPTDFQNFFIMDGDVGWNVALNKDNKIVFYTSSGTSENWLYSSVLATNTWYHILVRRVNTDQKRIVINGVGDASADDGFGANDNITYVSVGDLSSGYYGTIQVFRLWNKSIYEDYDKYMIEQLPSINGLKIWWDFSQGDATDLSGNGNDGTQTNGTPSYESFPDPEKQVW